MSNTDTGPRVGLVMGSDSDWPTMEAAAAVLQEHATPVLGSILID